jgi:pimeloyl-ACP methyl ester carboxylesterase
MTSTKNTAFVLVPGSFSPATYYEKVTPYLEADGYEALAVSLPSCNADDKRNERPATMLDDAAAISNVVSKLADKGKNVVVAMHSYGGFPGTESSKGLSKAERQQQSKEGGIVALVYLAAWLPTEGMSTYQMSGEPDVVKNAVSILCSNLRSV